jgi:Ca2+-binding RTX toxin-like protein
MSVLARGSETLVGSTEGDLLTGSEGNDTISGGSGIDTVSYSGSSSIAQIISLNTSEVRIVTPYAGTDTLSSIERVVFSDKSIAYDVAGNAGTAIKILGAVFGKSYVSNKEYVGIALDLLDKGMNYDTLTGLALGAANATTNDQIVTRLWTNLVGSAPSEADKAPIIQMLKDGMSPGVLARLAADTPLNATNINLVGLAQTGIEYTPVA